eukprot:3852758-Prymnesium_polylepis.1
MLPSADTASVCMPALFGWSSIACAHAGWAGESRKVGPAGWAGCVGGAWAVRGRRARGRGAFDSPG